MIVQLTVLTNAMAFFGQELGKASRCNTFCEERDIDQTSKERGIHARCPGFH